VLLDHCFCVKSVEKTEFKDGAVAVVVWFEVHQESDLRGSIWGHLDIGSTIDPSWLMRHAGK